MHRTNPRLDRFGCIVITTVTRYNEEDTFARLTRRVTTRRLLARGVFRSLAERSRANLLSRRNNETFSSLGSLNDFREKSWITRAGIVGEAVDRNRFRGNRMIAARSRFELNVRVLGILESQGFSFPSTEFAKINVLYASISSMINYQSFLLVQLFYFNNLIAAKEILHDCNMININV